jgi:hypothetical protein
MMNTEEIMQRHKTTTRAGRCTSCASQWPCDPYRLAEENIRLFNALKYIGEQYGDGPNTEAANLACYARQITNEATMLRST